VKGLATTIASTLVASGVAFAPGADASDLGLHTIASAHVAAQSPATADAGPASVHSASLPVGDTWPIHEEIAATTAGRVGGSRRRRVAIRTPDEDLGYFEREEQRQQLRHVRRAIRKAEQRAAFGWARSQARGWLDSGTILSREAPGAAREASAEGGGGWLRGVMAATDIDLGFDLGSGADVSLTYHVSRRGPDWFGGAALELDPLDAKVKVVVGLRRGSLCCGYSAQGGAQVAWSLPF